MFKAILQLRNVTGGCKRICMVAQPAGPANELLLTQTGLQKMVSMTMNVT